MESQKSTNKKGQVEGDEEKSESACSSLTLQGDLSGKPGSKSNEPIKPPITVSSSIVSSTPLSSGQVTSFPVPTDTYPPQPILSVVRPLTSTGLFSPPASLPPVQLPNHPPLSPIPYPPPAVSVSPNPADEQVDRLAIQLELTNLSSPGESEWDNYFRTPPTYNDQREFWDSRYEALLVIVRQIQRS